jgi:hypothetical protein
MPASASAAMPRKACDAMPRPLAAARVSWMNQQPAATATSTAMGLAHSVSIGEAVHR